MPSEVGSTSRAENILMKASFTCHRRIIVYQDSSHRIKSNKDHVQFNPSYVHNTEEEWQNCKSLRAAYEHKLTSVQIVLWLLTSSFSG